MIELSSVNGIADVHDIKKIIIKYLEHMLIRVYLKQSDLLFFKDKYLISFPDLSLIAVMAE